MPRYHCPLSSPITGRPRLLQELLCRVWLDRIQLRRVFRPLGISDFEWSELFAAGEPAAASGLRLRPRDTAKLGQLMLADGMWADQRVLPPGWVAESTKARLNGDNLTHYGYQWWIGETYVPEGTVKWVAGMGLGGQRLFIVPALDLVVVTNGGLYERGPIVGSKERSQRRF